MEERTIRKTTSVLGGAGFRTVKKKSQIEIMHTVLLVAIESK